MQSSTTRSIDGVCYSLPPSARMHNNKQGVPAIKIFGADKRKPEEYKVSCTTKIAFFGHLRK